MQINISLFSEKRKGAFIKAGAFIRIKYGRLHCVSAISLTVYCHSYHDNKTF